MLEARLGGRLHYQPPAHPQMNPPPAIGHTNDDVLAPPLNGLDDCALEDLHDLARRALEHLPPSQFHALDTPPREHRSQVSDHGFYFRQFRHWSSLTRMLARWILYFLSKERYPLPHEKHYLVEGADHRASGGKNPRRADPADRWGGWGGPQRGHRLPGGQGNVPHS